MGHLVYHNTKTNCSNTVVNTFFRLGLKKSHILTITAVRQKASVDKFIGMLTTYEEWPYTQMFFSCAATSDELHASVVRCA